MDVPSYPLWCCSGAVPVERRGDAVVVIAGEAVSDIAATLTPSGFGNLRDATSCICNHVNL